MIKKKLLTSAFTLIELLVVITIIGILAGIALPVFNSVQVKGAQTKCLAQAKQVGLALKLFATDQNGSYPIYQSDVTKAPGSGTASASNTSNQDFFALFPTYTQSESIFANKYNAFYNTKVPDNVLDAAGSQQQNTLGTGENAYSYIEGLLDSNNPASPLVMDAGKTDGTYQTTTPKTAGYVWGTNKAIVIHLDNSGGLDTLITSGGGLADLGPDPSVAASTANVNLLNPTTNKSLNGCFLVVPSH